jgi:hypothetical protein
MISLSLRKSREEERKKANRADEKRRIFVVVPVMVLPVSDRDPFGLGKGEVGEVVELFRQSSAQQSEKEEREMEGEVTYRVGVVAECFAFLPEEGVSGVAELPAGGGPGSLLHG